ncbi:class I SAM-dependent methyltransferase [Sphingobacterium sp. lm-10]|uniref:class I SAM-dependent methyltransferase n=1 Tax=Sphingobacterium sp. lm-10 TaxID=2944904 RepID=UPI00202214CA|nr:class I SAM-dependent methyltransferase [Sphingobacterium sp. lm-10]MCL7986433.1 class I SAM-dependent methyltransferase [Sphingobacterium sp. lm-10]
MQAKEDYLAINRASWNNRTDAHLKSSFYDMPGFLGGNNSLKDIELDLFGDVKGKSVLHLQCHFGQDSISLGRLGAEVTGVDLSDKAIESAVDIAAQTNSSAKFICSDIYELPAHLDKQFDFVFASYGTIGWLPDLDRWAKIVTHYLKPGGKFVFVEFHPVVWMFDDDFKTVHYNYFNAGAISENENGTYADKEAAINHDYVMWNHSLGDVLGSLLSNGLHLSQFKEYDYSPYDCFSHTEEFEPGKFRIKHLENKIPMLYSLLATKV